MAKGDTKTNQYLDIAANGTRADLPSSTCCETRTQTLIREVAERVMDVEEEVERLENNPDVVDIVDTYADLQSYSTSGLTDKDVIRVIADETKGGASSYYRWNSPNPGWNFVGVIPGGDGVKELSSADYNYPTANPDRVALWLLDNGLYTAPAGVMVAASTTSYPWYNTSDKTILVGGSDTVKGIYTFLNGKTDVVTTQVSDGTEADEYTLLKSNQVLQATGQSTTDTMSQKAITDALASAGGIKELTTADYNWPTNNPDGIALWLLDEGLYVYQDANMKTYIDILTPDATSSGILVLKKPTPIQSGTMILSKNNIKSVLVYGLSQAGQNATVAEFPITVTNNLTSTNAKYALSAKQGKVLKDLIDSIAIRGAGAPTTSTVGEVGQLYEDGTNGILYQLKSIDITVTPNTYNWEQVGGSSVNVVQSTGISTTDVMSQNAVTSMVFADPATQYEIKIGAGASDAEGNNAIEIGHNATATGANGIALGYGAATNFGNAIAIGRGASPQGNTSICIGQSATASAQSAAAIGAYANAASSYSVALGFGSTSSAQGEVGIGLLQTYANAGYNNSAYRLLTGLYDPQSAHDAATKGYVDGLISALEARIAALEGN